MFIMITLREGSFGLVMLVFIMQIILFRTDCLLPSHNFTLHGPESRTNHFAICIFFFGNNCFLLVGVAIVNYLSPHEESALEWIIFLDFHAVNIRNFQA